MWCGGARETRELHVTLGRTVSKSETTKNLPPFQDLNGTFFSEFVNYYKYDLSNIHHFFDDSRDLTITYFTKILYSKVLVFYLI